MLHASRIFAVQSCVAELLDFTEKHENRDKPDDKNRCIPAYPSALYITVLALLTVTPILAYHTVPHDHICGQSMSTRI